MERAARALRWLASAGPRGPTPALGAAASLLNPGNDTCFTPVFGGQQVSNQLLCAAGQTALRPASTG
eukprot:6397870-Alexandrium_andersonii.AAC.1